MTAGETKKEDEVHIVELLHELSCDDVSVNTFFRLGKKPDDQNVKLRPIKITFATDSQKDKVLLRSKNLRRITSTRFKELWVHQDLTPRQRARRRRLVEELKSRQEAGETNLILADWKIVTRRTRSDLQN